MKTILTLFAFIMLVSCSPQYPHKITYQLPTSYDTAKDLIKNHNESSETEFGWITDQVRFPQEELTPGKKLVFQSIKWTPDLGYSPVFEGVLNKDGARSILSLVELSNPQAIYDAPRAVLGPDLPPLMKKYDTWVTQTFKVSSRVLVLDENSPPLYGSTTN